MLWHRQTKKKPTRDKKKYIIDHGHDDVYQVIVDIFLSV
jgi:hypothetical protein